MRRNRAGRGRLGVTTTSVANAMSRARRNDLRLERRDIGQSHDRPQGQVRIVAPQYRRQKRVLHLAGEQDDRIKHGYAQSPVGPEAIGSQKVVKSSLTKPS